MIRIPHPYLVLLMVGATVGLGGCASWFNPIGEETFDCNRKQDPNSPYCRSFKAVESGTGGALPPSRFDREFKMEDVDRLNKIAPDTSRQETRPADATGGATNGILPHQVSRKPSLDGRPVREAGVVQRVVIYRWKDSNDTLHEGEQIVYHEIKPARWVGFEATPKDGGRAGRYPHRVEAAQAVSSSPKVAARPAPPQPTSGFAQPGNRVANDVETASTPAENGANSMPD